MSLIDHAIRARRIALNARSALATLARRYAPTTRANRAAFTLAETVTALCIWEYVDHASVTEPRHPLLTSLRQNIGTWALREQCALIAPYCERVFALLPPHTASLRLGDRAAYRRPAVLGRCTPAARSRHGRIRRRDPRRQAFINRRAYIRMTSPARLTPRAANRYHYGIQRNDSVLILHPAARRVFHFERQLL